MLQGGVREVMAVGEMLLMISSSRDLVDLAAAIVEVHLACGAPSIFSMRTLYGGESSSISPLFSS